ncbi:MAG: VOC family protein [Acidobacteria bacterium]|nr:VOC family protein [Acidobacteriota bacterium]MBV9476772.1 VOC family protein [Acidobacteriota bacterium]
MATFTSHPPGTFNWIELATNDVAAARAFYTALFGWDVTEIKGEWGSYFIFRNKERDAGAMFDPGADKGPPHWISYVSVTDADETVAKANSLGATVVAPPYDVSDYGRSAVLQDPQGATFAIWQARSGIGLHVRDEVNALCWNELHARDVERARQFYSALFQWRAKESPEYTEWHVGEHAIGGMLAGHDPSTPPFWLPYFSVADCDATVAAAEGQGAKVHLPPMSVEHIGRFSILADPQGAAFAVIRLAS